MKRDIYITYEVKIVPNLNQKEIYSYLKDLTMEMMKLKGYKPETASLLQEMDDEEKESDLVQHSVKLAVAYALIILPEGIPIGIIKNREITLRDGSRFHHFSDGKCSCADYW